MTDFSDVVAQWVSAHVARVNARLNVDLREALRLTPIERWDDLFIANAASLIQTDVREAAAGYELVDGWYPAVACVVNRP